MKQILLVLALSLCGCVSKVKYNHDLKTYFLSGIIVGREQMKQEIKKDLENARTRESQSVPYQEWK